MDGISVEDGASLTACLLCDGVVVRTHAVVEVGGWLRDRGARDAVLVRQRRRLVRGRGKRVQQRSGVQHAVCARWAGVNRKQTASKLGRAELPALPAGGHAILSRDCFRRPAPSTFPTRAPTHLAPLDPTPSGTARMPPGQQAARASQP